MALLVTHASEETEQFTALAGAVVGQIAIPGRGEHVRATRAFVAEVLGRLGVAAGAAAADTAVLLTSELVTNAIRHTRSGTPGGLVLLAVRRLAGGILVEVTDSGSACGMPVVKDNVYTCDGHGLFLVEAMADQWGYRCADAIGTTVWFRLSLG
jgi:serine/threonine-protein kinase RsbW